MTQVKTKPSGIKYLDVEVPDGEGGLRRARISLDTRDPAEAEKQRRAWIAGTHPKHPAQGGVVAPKGRKPQRDTSTIRKDGTTLYNWLETCLEELWAPHLVKAVATHQSNVRILQRHFGADALVSELTAQRVADFAKELRAKGYAEGSIKKLLGTLSRALRHASNSLDAAGGKVLDNRPNFPTISVRNKQDRVVSRVEETAMFDAIDARLEREPNRPWWRFKMLIVLMIDGGFRLGEALSLGPRSIRDKRWLDPVTGAARGGRFLALDRYATKTDRPREVPATARILAALPALNAQAVRGQWFGWGKRTTGPWYLWDNIRDDLAKAGHDFSDVRLHTLRHTCLTRLAEGGMDLLALRDWAGHSDIKITAERYIHLMSSHLYRGAAILDSAPVLQEPIDDSNGGHSTNENYRDSGGNCATVAQAHLH
ncbi:site-specific integrase [Sphingomonas sp.]|uniref:tyrosine-type recombinase/integrase n=1 Tax=Sphingomonas sp. TaxID=28214 RepID=UPI002ED92936